MVVQHIPTSCSKYSAAVELSKLSAAVEAKQFPSVAVVAEPPNQVAAVDADLPFHLFVTEADADLSTKIAVVVPALDLVD